MAGVEGRARERAQRQQRPVVNAEGRYLTADGKLPENRVQAVVTFAQSLGRDEEQDNVLGVDVPESLDELGLVFVTKLVDMPRLNALAELLRLVGLVGPEAVQRSHDDGDLAKYHGEAQHDERLPLPSLPNEVHEVRLAVGQVKHGIDLVGSGLGKAQALAENAPNAGGGQGRDGR